jgi:plastocyanin
MRSKIWAWTLVLGFLLAGCMDASTDDAGDEPGGEDEQSTDTGDSDGTVQPPDEALEVRTSGTYPLNPGFSPDRLEVTSGAQVTLVFHNDDTAAQHAWRVEGISESGTENVGPGASAEVAFLAPEPGEYVFYCPVGNHRQLGQEGVLVVKES